MKYTGFEIRNYRAIEGPLFIDLSKNSLVPIVGINECGKTTILQAIYCFDYLNDAEYSGKHLKDTKNLYKTSEKFPPVISANVEIKYTQLAELYQDFLYSKSLKNTTEEIEEIDDENYDENGKEDILDISEISVKLPINKTDKLILSIDRDLTSQKYFIRNWPKYEVYTKLFHNLFSEYLISRLPYILYNDDFMDRPPTFIRIPNIKPKLISGWISIYERLFNSTDEEYSLFKIINESDSRRRDAIISDVQEVINKTLSKAWKTFLLGNHSSLQVKLSIIPNSNNSEIANFKNVLEIKIVEKIQNKERPFHVIDRSKGFLWFFNFVMKLEFNPKIIGDAKNTIYLLDEPGSYLHYTAQEKLCKKLVDISTNHGNVIYCTHSHTLLNPKLIPLNSIYIVEKDKNKNINATRLPQVKTKIESNNAYQPIHEALQISAFNFGTNSHTLIAVEGIYDKYAIELFIDLEKNISILPGTSADSIKKNIQFLNAFNKEYVAIWDNDTEGREHYKKAAIFFGEFESQKFDLLPSKNAKDRRMEEMFNPIDLELINKELGLDKNTSYERTISNLYYAKSEKKKKILKAISEETFNNFKVLKTIIDKRLKISKNLMTP